MDAVRSTSACGGGTGHRNTPHDDPTSRVEPAARLVFDDRAQGRGQLRARNDLEAERRIERHVPWNVAEGARRSQSPSSVRGIDVDLVEVCDTLLEHFDMRKAHSQAVCQSDPETAFVLSPLQ